jgi:hypothetical protein
LAATTKKFDSKKNVWISDPEEGFIAVEIKSAKGDMVTVVTSKGTEVKSKIKWALLSDWTGPLSLSLSLSPSLSLGLGLDLSLGLDLGLKGQYNQIKESITDGNRVFFNFLEDRQER